MDILTIYNTVRYRTFRILTRDRMDMSRLGLIAGAFLWAVFLLVPFAASPPSITATHRMMSIVLTEATWGILFLINGAAAAYTLFTGVRSTITLLLDGVLGCVLWTGAMVACVAAHWPSYVGIFGSVLKYSPPAAMSGEVVMAFFSWWHMIRYWAEEPTIRTGNNNE